MKNRLVQVTAVAAGTLVLSAAMQGGSFSELLVDSALTGGGMWANATSIGQLPYAVAVDHH